MSHAARVTVVTAGHLATSPRMLKAADALAGAGYRVRVVSTRHTPWADAADVELLEARGHRAADGAARAAGEERRGQESAAAWTWRAVDYRRGSARRTYALSGARRRAASAVAGALGPGRAPLALAARAYARVHAELVRAALAEPADVFYGGTTGALAAVAGAARRARAPYALDLEDFHSGERADGPGTRLVHGLARRIERAVLPAAAFVTAASPAIAAAYREAYGLEVAAIHNTFPLPSEPPAAAERAGPLRLYWVSQTIGGGRGLEQVVRAAGRAGVAAELHLRGRPAEGYLDRLRRLAARDAPRLDLVVHPPASPAAMVDLAREHDVGLAVEPGSSLNNRLALSNKVFTYLLAGLAVLLTDTPGQRPLGLDVAEAAALCPPGDEDALAAALVRWASDANALARARAAAWRAARRRWHWEHADDRGALLDRFRTLLG